jgi:asparagine synthase (glutamine-hydrolysing)
MCGLAGLFVPEGARMQRADVAAMMTAMAHRGPDGEGRYESEDGRFQAGFVRLAIIDLEAGDQPFVDRDAGRVLMGNGEIYNYLELRDEMRVRNYPYTSQGDIEVVLALARAYGDDFVHHLNGMYALALYESGSHRLLLVRDHLGVKPLYWARLAGGAVVFASEIKALFASGLIAPAIDEAAVSAYLAHGFVPGPAALFKGVRKLQPGRSMSVGSDGEVCIRRYWRPAPAPSFPDDRDAMADHLIALLRDSLRLQLRSDVPVGVLLSGGIDSGLMVALAADQVERPLQTFTVRFQGGDVDESPLAALVAARYGASHNILDLPAESAAAHLPKLAWYCEEPLNDAALLPNYLVETELSRHVKVALNGTGGDELFAGYRRYFRLGVERAYLRLPAWTRAALIEPAAAKLAPMTAWKLGRAAAFDGNRGTYLHDHACHFPPPMRALIGCRLAPPDKVQEALFDEFDGPAQSASLYTDLNAYLPEDLLTLLDRTSMAVSVEARVPFLDHRLVEAALAVPPAVRTPDDRQKGLQRAIAARFLPDAVLEAPKRGFVSPLPAWLEAGLAAPIRSVLTRPDTLARGWWSAQGIERLLARPRDHAYRLYSLLMLELAVRVHIEGAHPSVPPPEPLEAFADAA